VETYLETLYQLQNNKYKLKINICISYPTTL